MLKCERLFYKSPFVAKIFGDGSKSRLTLDMPIVDVKESQIKVFKVTFNFLKKLQLRLLVSKFIENKLEKIIMSLMLKE